MSAPHQTPTPTKLRILVADDSRFQLEPFRAVLEDRGFEVMVARDALQAGMFALRTIPDAIVLDLSMPGGSGIQVLQKVEAIRKDQINSGNDRNREQ